MKLKYILILFAILFTSCVKDNSSTDIIPLNNIKIENFEASYIGTLNESFNIDPTVTIFDENVSYLWYIYSDDSKLKIDTISKEKNLNVVLSGDTFVPGIDYFLVFKVIDNKTNIYESKTAKLVVGSDYTYGQLFLCETDGKIHLDMLRNDNKYFTNIYSLNNQGKILDNTVNKIIIANPLPHNIAFKQIFLFAKNADGGYILDPVTMSQKFTIRSLMDEGMKNAILEPTFYSLAGMIEYIIINGKMHKRATNMQKISFESDALVAFGGATTYKVTALLGNDYEPYVYDELNGRFMRHTTWNAGALKETTNGGDKSNFDVTNIGDYAMLVNGILNAPMQYWMIGKERSTSEISVFKVSTTFPDEWWEALPLTDLQKVRIDASVGPNFIGATNIVSSILLPSRCFYVNKNKVYTLNIENISENTLGEAELLDLGSQNLTITGLKIVETKVDDAKNPGSLISMKQLRVMVQDNTLSEKKGGVIYYEISTTSGLMLIENDRFIGGKCDKVIDIEDKLN